MAPKGAVFKEVKSTYTHRIADRISAAAVSPLFACFPSLEWTCGAVFCTQSPVVWPKPLAGHAGQCVVLSGQPSSVQQLLQSLLQCSWGRWPVKRHTPYCTGFPSWLSWHVISLVDSGQAVCADMTAISLLVLLLLFCGLLVSLWLVVLSQLFYLCS